MTTFSNVSSGAHQFTVDVLSPWSGKLNLEDRHSSSCSGRKSRFFIAHDTFDDLIAVKQLYSQDEFLKHRYDPRYVTRIFSSPDGFCTLAHKAVSAGKVLHHPHIMKVYGQFLMRTRDGQIHSGITQEYIKGESLEKIPSRSVSRKTAVRYTVQLISALQYALSKQLIHLDLVDEHVMIDKKGVKLIALESFEKIPAGFTCDATHRAWLGALDELCTGLLEKGAFNGSERSFLLENLQRLVNTNRIPILDKNMMARSPRFLSLVLEKIKKSFVSASRALHHPVKRLQYRVFQSKQAHKRGAPPTVV